VRKKLSLFFRLSLIRNPSGPKRPDALGLSKVFSFRDLPIQKSMTENMKRKPLINSSVVGILMSIVESPNFTRVSFQVAGAAKHIKGDNVGNVLKPSMNSSGSPPINSPTANSAEKIILVIEKTRRWFLRIKDNTRSCLIKVKANIAHPMIPIIRILKGITGALA
jgi:hypothetical protein